MKLETERLILRPWRVDDAESLYHYAKDPDIGHIAGWPPHTSVENSREIIRDVLSDVETYAVCLKGEDVPIGSIGLMFTPVSDLCESNDEAELGYWIGKPHWGNGYIPEASLALIDHGFEQLKLDTIWCGYYNDNSKSRRVIEKCGFSFIRTNEKQPCELMGDERTTHVYKMTRENWEDRRNQGEAPSA